MTKKSGFFSKLKSTFTRQKDTTVGTSDEVITSLEEQLKQTPNNFRLRLKLADTFLSRGERETALEEYCKSARLYLKHDFTPLAVATYKKIIHEEPKHLEANLELGRIYQQNKFYADATSHFHKAFDYYQENCLNDEALQTLETIIEIAPDKEPYRLLLQELFPDHQESEKSIYSDIIVTQTPSEPQAFSENTDEKEIFFDLGAELGDEIGELSVTETSTDSTEGPKQLNGVEEIFQTLKSTFQEEENNPESDKFHYNLALAYKELNLPEQALQESEEALKSTNFRLPALLLRSRIFLSLGASSTALSQVQQGLLEKGLTRQDFLAFKMQLGLILKEMGHYHQALEAFREANAVDPGNKELAREIHELENPADQT